MNNIGTPSDPKAEGTALYAIRPNEILPHTDGRGALAVEARGYTARSSSFRCLSTWLQRRERSLGKARKPQRRPSACKVTALDMGQLRNGIDSDNTAYAHMAFVFC